MPPVQPIQPAQPVMPGGAGMAGVTGATGVTGAAGAAGVQPLVNGAGQRYYTAEQVEKLLEPKKDIAGLIKTIVIIIVSLIAVTFIGLFIWMYVQYSTAEDDIEERIAVKVADAEVEKATEMELEFAEREKDPYRDFVGPADYGQLSFKYPKTWSVYVEEDAASGGDYSAYFNPIQVNTVARDTINALRVTIRDKSFEDVAAEYQRYMDRKDSDLAVESVTVAGAAANRYTGTIPDTDLSGVIVIFRIRDKTVILQTDSMLFVEDFDRLLTTIQFNA